MSHLFFMSKTELTFSESFISVVLPRRNYAQVVTVQQLNIRSRFSLDFHGFLFPAAPASFPRDRDRWQVRGDPLFTAFFLPPRENFLIFCMKSSAERERERSGVSSWMFLIHFLLFQW